MLNTKEAAQHIGCAAITLAKLRCYGGGPTYHKIGRSVRYTAADLDHWTAQCRRQSTSEYGSAAVGAPVVSTAELAAAG